MPDKQAFLWLAVYACDCAGSRAVYLMPTSSRQAITCRRHVVHIEAHVNTARRHTFWVMHACSFGVPSLAAILEQNTAARLLWTLEARTQTHTSDDAVISAPHYVLCLPGKKWLHTGVVQLPFVEPRSLARVIQEALCCGVYLSDEEQVRRTELHVGFC